MKRWLHLFGRLIVLALFIAAAWLLYKRLEEYTLADIWRAVLQVSAGQIAAAAALTVLNYLILVGYDWLAVRWIKEPVPLWKIAFASFTGYTFSYNFGATLFGTAIRYRLYSLWGMPVWKILELLVILGLTFWFGLFALSGVLFILDPLEIPIPIEQLPENIREWAVLFQNTYWSGWVLLAIASGYVGLSAFYRGSVKLWRWVIPVPALKLTLMQIIIASADLLVFAAVLYAVMPTIEGMDYFKVLGIFILAYVASVLSHVPGGYGVIEFMILLFVPKDHLLAATASLLVFRLVFFWVPVLLSAVMLGLYELTLRQAAPSAAPTSAVPVTPLPAPPSLPNVPPVCKHSPNPSARGCGPVASSDSDGRKATGRGER
jgi:uncharacterized membrane protein YbhN (UPF0104 family)